MGRPREFDLDAAIDLATLLFWQNGYEGTLLSDLTSTIGLTSPRLYFAFGGMEGLFRRVIERYGAKQRLVSEQPSESRQTPVASLCRCRHRSETCGGPSCDQ
jgi:AcrR family transcriptional regulator